MNVKNQPTSNKCRHLAMQQLPFSQHASNMHKQKLGKQSTTTAVATLTAKSAWSQSAKDKYVLLLPYLPVLRSHAAILLGNIVSWPFSASPSVHSLRRRSMPTTPNAVLLEGGFEEDEACSGAADAEDVGGSTIEVVSRPVSSLSSIACSSSSCDCSDC